MSREHLDPSDDAKYLAAHIERLAENVERLVDIMERLAPLIDPRFINWTPANCTCTQSPNGPIPGTVACPIHGGRFYSPTTTG